MSNRRISYKDRLFIIPVSRVTQILDPQIANAVNMLEPATHIIWTSFSSQVLLDMLCLDVSSDAESSEAPVLKNQDPYCAQTLKAPFSGYLHPEADASSQSYWHSFL
jgi:hypothetical protein